MLNCAWAAGLSKRTAAYLPLRMSIRKHCGITDVSTKVLSEIAPSLSKRGVRATSALFVSAEDEEGPANHF